MKNHIISLFVLLCACSATPVGPRFDAVEFAKNVDHLADLEERTKRVQERFVWIVADDIELPLATAGANPPDEKEYTFYVWAKLDKPLDAVLQKELLVDVLGADATIAPVRYPEANLPGKVAKELPSASVIKVTVKSGAIHSNLTILAWHRDLFPKYETDRLKRIDEARARVAAAKLKVADAPGDKELRKKLQTAYRELEVLVSRPNPYGEVKRVRVFNGDLHTSISILSLEEARDAFGKNFARYFYVGRAYFWNPHPDKKLIINTTSLRARTLFYREPNPELAKYFLSAQDKGDFARYEYLERSGVTLRSDSTVSGLSKERVRQLVGIARRLVGKLAGKMPSAAQWAEPLARLAFDNAAQEEEAARIMEKACTLCHSAFQDQLKAVRSGEKGDMLGGELRRIWEAEDPRQEAVRLAQETKLPALLETWEDVARQLSEFVSDQLAVVSPLQQPLPFLAAPEMKELAASPLIFTQGENAAAGYLFRDYYRPMTFESVLVSLLRKADEEPARRVLAWLESAGVVAAALVGLSPSVQELGSDAYVKTVAVTTGVIIPELRTLLLRDVSEYLTNLSTLALETQFTLGPLQSKDGYVFFPRGPIFGFNVDEFSIDQPSFIVNIDNVDVKVDGRLVSKDEAIVSGLVAAEEQVSATRDRGKSIRDERNKELARVAAQLRDFRLAALESDVDQLVKASRPDEARKLISAFEDTFGKDTSGVVARLRARIDSGPGSSGLRIEPDGDHVLLKEAAGAFEGTYKIRLDKALPDELEAFVAVTGQSSDNKPRVEVELFVGTKSISKKGTMAQVRFATEAKDGALVWHTDVEVKVTVKNEPGVRDALLSVRNEVTSAAPEVGGAVVLAIELPEEEKPETPQ